MFAQLSENEDAEAALAAYQDSLRVWSPETDHEAWVKCHEAIGLILARLHPVGSSGADQAIAKLELAVEDRRYLASALAHLYSCRAAGDPGQNWERRVRYLGLALNQVSREQNPTGWASIKNELGLLYRAASRRFQSSRRKAAGSSYFGALAASRSKMNLRCRQPVGP
jgi:hypothetical protein